MECVRNGAGGVRYGGGGVLCGGVSCVEGCPVWGGMSFPTSFLSFKELLYVSCGCQQYQGNVYLRRKAQTLPPLNIASTY